MSQPFIGEIRMFAGNFNPRGWACCDGQLLAVSQNDALFSLIGTIYGGDGRTTFALPEMRGRIPIHIGSGPGLTSRPIGQRSGSEDVTITNPNHVPVHTHDLQGVSSPAASRDPGGNHLAIPPNVVHVPQNPDADMQIGSISPGNPAQSHENVMPFLVVKFIIALTGTFPSRS